MADEKRIIEFEPATDIENDDWFAVDSANVGTRKIQKSMFMANEIASLSQLGVDMIGAQANIENLQTRAGMATALNFGDNLTDGVNTLKTIEGTDAYVNTATYAVGDYCIYNKTLYKCNTAVTSGEEFDPSKWTATSIKNEFSELNSNYTQIGNQISTAKIGIDSSNKTTFTFQNLHNLNANMYKHGLVIIGTGSTNCTVYMLWINDSNTDIIFKNLTSTTVRNLTGSISGTTLTITADSTAYGGIKLLWLN